MITPTGLLHSLEERKPTLATMPGLGQLESAISARSWGASDLSAPPTDSGLASVPGDYGLPYIGHALGFLRRQPDFLLDRYKKFGAINWSGLLGRPVVWALGPAATEEVLVNRDKVYSQSGWEHFIGPFFPRGLMLLDAPEHRVHRLIMQEAFRRDRLVDYSSTIDQVVSDTMSGWPVDEPSFRMHDGVKELALGVANVVFMGGARGSVLTRENRAFTNMVRAGTSLIRYPVPPFRWWKGTRGRIMLEEYFRSNIPARRAGQGTDLFTALCQARSEEGDQFTDEDIVNHMIFLIMAAHDTSTTTTTAMAYYLAAHPEWQDRARAESLALGPGGLTLEGLEQLSTLELVMKEALRLISPVPLMVRRASADTSLQGHHVPKGTIVIAHPWLNHRLPDIWAEPDKFDPERFNDERREDKVHKYAYAPFGGGVHKCIGMHFGGMEVKTILHRLLSGFRLELEPGYTPHWDMSSLPFPADGMPITLRRL